MRKSTCEDCPFIVKNLLKFKSGIYDDVKEKNNKLPHKCHKIGDFCVGFKKEAEEREDQEVLKNY